MFNHNLPNVNSGPANRSVTPLGNAINNLQSRSNHLNSYQQQPQPYNTNISSNNDNINLGFNDYNFNALEQFALQMLLGPSNIARNTCTSFNNTNSNETNTIPTLTSTMTNNLNNNDNVHMQTSSNLNQNNLMSNNYGTPNSHLYNKFKKLDNSTKEMLKDYYKKRELTPSRITYFGFIKSEFNALQEILDMEFINSDIDSKDNININTNAINSDTTASLPAIKFESTNHMNLACTRDQSNLSLKNDNIDVRDKTIIDNDNVAPALEESNNEEKEVMENLDNINEINNEDNNEDSNELKQVSDISDDKGNNVNNVNNTEDNTNDNNYSNNGDRNNSINNFKNEDTIDNKNDKDKDKDRDNSGEFDTSNLNESPGIKSTMMKTRGSRFGRNQSLSNTNNNNNKKNKHICPVCQNSFPYSAKLSGHLQIHGQCNEIPYKCDINTCGKVFIYNRNLKLHKTAKHTSSAKPYECKYCNKKLTTSHQLLLHIKICKNDRKKKTYKCDVDGCNHGLFTQKRSLENHKRLKHGTVSSN